MKKENIQNKHIKKNDKVKVISGNFRGKIGVVLSRTETTAIVQGINMRKKHVKKSQNQPGRIVELERPIHISNMRLCDDNGKPIKIKARNLVGGGRELYYIDGEQEIIHRKK